MNRREFVGRTVSAGLAAAFTRSAAWAAPVSAQKFSVMLWVLPKPLTMEQRLDIVAKAGYQGGEMVFEWREWSAEERKRIVAKKNALGLTFDLMFPSSASLNDPAARGKLKQEIEQAIPIAHEIGCPQFGFKSGPRIEGQTMEEQKQHITESLKVAVETCHGSGVELLLEPIDTIEDKHQVVNSVSEAFEIARAVGDPSMKVLYDFYHEQRGGGNLIEKLEKNLDLVALVHIADVPGRHKPGTGEIDYINIYRKLAELKYNRYITMEFIPTGNPVEELKAAKAEVLTAMHA